MEPSARFVGEIPEHYDAGLGPVIFADAADDLARRVAALSPSSVLEIAAGSGIVSRRLRDAMAPEARLVVSDLNPPMLAVARRKFSEGERVEFSEADAMALPFGQAEFDFLVCQFGVMFFPDKVASFREAARVLRPGGHYLFNVWSSMAVNPFAEINQEVLGHFFPQDTPGFYRVPFSYPDPDVVRRDLAAAGWTDVAIETVRFSKTIADPAGFAHGVVYGNPLIAEIHERGGASPAEVEAAILAGYRSRFGSDPMVMPLEELVITCRAH